MRVVSRTEKDDSKWDATRESDESNAKKGQGLEQIDMKIDHSNGYLSEPEDIGAAVMDSEPEGWVWRDSDQEDQEDPCAGKEQATR